MTVYGHLTKRPTSGRKNRSGDAPLELTRSTSCRCYHAEDACIEEPCTASEPRLVLTSAPRPGNQFVYITLGTSAIQEECKVDFGAREDEDSAWHIASQLSFNINDRLLTPAV